MKLIIDKKELNEAIQHVSKAISNRSTIPILTGIKIVAEPTGLSLTASDTEISIQSFIPQEIGEKTIVRLEQPGSVVLPTKFFVDIIRKLPQDEVEIEVNEQFHATIRSGKSELQLVGMDPEEYPILPGIEENQVLRIHSELLRSMIYQTIFAVSTNESTAILTGIAWTLRENTLKFTATDRHRLAEVQSTVDNEDQLVFENLVISGKNLNELYKLLPDQNTLIDIIVADNQILFKQDRILFYSHILDGVYPDTSRIIPDQYQTELTIDTKQFLNAMDRANLLSREEKTNIVKVETLEDQQIEITSSSSELGKIKEQLHVETMIGEPLKISFNSKYMLDALKCIDSKEIHIGFTGAMSPIIIKPHSDDVLIYLILPYRTMN